MRRATLVLWLTLLGSAATFGYSAWIRWYVAKLASDGVPTPGTVDSIWARPKGDDSVYGIRVTYEPANGERRSESFGVNREGYDEARVFRSVTVRYLERYPSLVSVPGMRTRQAWWRVVGAVSLAIATGAWIIRRRSE